MLSANHMEVNILRTGDWWLGNPAGRYYTAASDAIQKVWKKDPILTRSGGTIPTTTFLEETLKCVALHLPMGQASDNQHLPNERIRIENLLKGKEVIKEFLKNMPQKEAESAQHSSSTVTPPVRSHFPTSPVEKSHAFQHSQPFDFSAYHKM